MSDQNIAVRLKLLIEKLGISNSQFADECNISRPTLSQLVTGRNKKVSDVIIGQIHAAYPNLSVLWLLFGEGNIWVDQSLSDITHGKDGCAEINPETTGEMFSDNTYYNDTCDQEDLYGENACEILKSRTINQVQPEYAKEIPFKQSENASQMPIDEEIKRSIKNADFLADLARKREKNRKVVQITIYYDDSTFETFYPGKS